MKKTLWRIISCILTVCLLVMSLNYLTKLMELKAAITRDKPFFEQEADFDVLFIGSSHVTAAVLPMELWNDYGIISYNFGRYGSYIPTTYWVMKNTLNHTTPKLIVVDCYLLNEAYKTTTIYSNMHQSLDAFPLSTTKIKAVQDLLDDPVIAEMLEDGTLKEAERRTPIGLLWDFSVYHMRWNELGKNDFQVAASSGKGADFNAPVAVPDNEPKIGRNEKLEEDTVGVEYLNKIIETCQERGIDILLTYIPFPASAKDQKDANRVYDIAGEYGVNYINFLDMDIVDYDTDCNDRNSHLNASGAWKVTDYLGKYIMEHYQISDQRGNPEYSGWFADYEVYTAMKRETLLAQCGWDSYMMLLADKSLDVLIEIRNPDMRNDNRFVNLVENLGIDMADVSEVANFLLICGGDRQTEVIALNTDTDVRKNTAMGLLRVSYDESGEYGVYLDDTECFFPGWGIAGAIRIYVRDSESLNMVGRAVF